MGTSRTENSPAAVRVAWVAHGGAGPETGTAAETFMRQVMPAGSFQMTSREPDIILFMSGGSERAAITLTDPSRPVLLLSIPGNNAYAAATEVMAWMVNSRRVALLSDGLDARDSGLAERWRLTVAAWRRMEGKRAGLIGSVSEWLVASDVPEALLAERFGVILETLPWNGLPGFRDQEPDEALLRRFGQQQVAGLTDAARVLTLLRRVISNHNLDALAVECFSLVQQQRVTACLALAQLNSEGMPAACEGDLASLAGMMLLATLTGRVPWMANTTAVTGNRLLLTHCTIGFDLIRNPTLTTHYETGYSLAVRGNPEDGDVTLFRLSDTLGKAFLAEGKTTGSPCLSGACRTQMEAELPPPALSLLQTRPLGNHLLVIPGKRAALLRLACAYKGIEVLS